MYKIEDKIKEFVDTMLPLIPDSILLIGGDIGHINAHNLVLFKHLSKIYDKILVVFGNHDYYLVSGNQREKYNRNSFNRVNEMKAFLKPLENVHVLDGNIIEHNGVKYTGTGMWYDGKLSNVDKIMTEEQIKDDWLYFMNDSNYIYNISTYKYIFDDEIKKLENNIYKSDVILSHIGPALPPVIPTKYDNSYTRFFYFDGSEYLKAKAAPKVWVYGHVHDQYDYTVNNTNLVCNPLGYPKENALRNRKIKNYIMED